MIVGKSGEVKLNCGGVPNLLITAVWEERVDTSANNSAIAVTGMTVTAAEMGRYTLEGSVSMNGAVLGRLSGCTAEVVDGGLPAEVSGEVFPIVSAPISHKEYERAVVTVQLAGETPNGQRFYGTGYISLELTVQPCISEVTASSPFIGSPMSIAVIAAGSEFVHTLRYEFEGVSGVIAEGLRGGRHTWIPPMEMCAAIPHKGQGECLIFCDTYNKGSLMGTASCAVSLWVPMDVALEFSEGWVTLEPANEGTVAEGVDCCVQGISSVRAVFDESKIRTDFAYGAYPVAYDMTVGGVKYDNPYASEVLHSYGVVPVTCGVTDSRGRRYEAAMTVAVLPYALPVMGDVTVFRCDADGAENERGNCLSVSAGYGISALAGRNHGTVYVKLRRVGDVWREPVALIDGSYQVLWAGEISPNDTYEVLLEAVDALGGSTSLTVTLPCTNVFFHGRKGGLGAAFGKPAEADNVLEVAWNLKTKGNLVVEGSVTIGGKDLWEHLYPVGAVFGCSASADPASLFGGVWEETDGVCHWVRTA